MSTNVECCVKTFLIYDYMFRRTALSDMQSNSSVELTFLYSIWICFVMILGWQFSQTLRESDHCLMSKLIVMASKQSEYFLQTYVQQFAH